MTKDSYTRLPGKLLSLRRSLKYALYEEPFFFALSCVNTLLPILPELALVLIFHELANIRKISHSMIYTISVTFTLLIIFQWFIQLFTDRIQYKFGNRLTVKLETNIASLQSTYPTLTHHERTDVLDLLTVLREQVFALSKLFSSIFNTVSTILRVLILFILLESVSVWLLLSIPFSFLPVLISSKTSERTRQILEKYSEDDRHSRHFLMLTTEPSPAKGIRTDKTIFMVDQLQSKYRQIWFHQVSKSRRLGALAQTVGWFMFSAILTSSLLLTWHQSNNSYTSIVIILIVGSRITNAILNLVSEVNFLRDDWSGVSQRLAWLEDQTLSSFHGDRPMPKKIDKGITLNNLSFTYPEMTDPIISNLNMHLPAGSIVALVGKNGSGKSSIVKLLSRLYDPDTGSITLDDEPISNIDITEWRKNISVIFQDFFSFELTLRESVGLGDISNIYTNSVEESLKKAGALDILQKSPRGFQQKLGDRWPEGIGLSFGQWQKIAVARGLMRQNPLLRIVDEPSSSLDPGTEHEIFKIFSNITKEDREIGAITLIVSHRFSTVQLADIIFVIDDKSIIECGSHEELMSSKGWYSEMYKYQEDSYSIKPAN